MVRKVIEKVEIDFPYEPYDCQMVYMTRVLQALELVCIPKYQLEIASLFLDLEVWRSFGVAYRDRKDAVSVMCDSRMAAETEGVVETNISRSHVIGKRYSNTVLLSNVKWFSASEQSNSNSGSVRCPLLSRVYYCSRTHSQLAQVVRELNKTMYKMWVSSYRSFYKTSSLFHL